MHHTMLVRVLCHKLARIVLVFTCMAPNRFCSCKGAAIMRVFTTVIGYNVIVTQENRPAPVTKNFVLSNLWFVILGDSGVRMLDDHKGTPT